MVSKDVWSSLSKSDKRLRLIDCLSQLRAIETGKHDLSGTPDQGRLCNVRKDLEEFIIHVAEWEK